MKKTLTLAVAIFAILVGYAAPDKVYLKGGGLPSDWNGTEMKLQSQNQNRNQEYVYFGYFSELNSDFKISENYGSTNWSGINYGSGEKISKGNTITCYYNGGNIGINGGSVKNVLLRFYWKNNSSNAYLQVGDMPTIWALTTNASGTWNLTSGTQLNNTDFIYKGQLTISTDNTHVIFAENLGDWDKVNGARYVPSTGTDVTVTTPENNEYKYNGNMKMGADGSYVLDQGSYNVTIDFENLSIIIEKIVTPWRIKVSYSDQTKTDRNIFLQKNVTTGLWEATFKAHAEDGWSQFSIYDGNKSQDYSLNDLTLSEQSLSGILVEWPEVKNQNKSHFRLESDKDYTLTWNETTHEVKLSYEGETVYPKTLYVTGQVNGKDWNYDNVVAMEADGDGKFKLNNLDLSTWQGRVNFCANVGSDWNAQRPQFGSDITTPGVKTDDNGIIVDFGNNNSFTGNLVENNAKCKEFKLPNGHYDVTVDMTTTPMTVTFVKNEELKFSWHSESNSITEENGVSTHRGLVHQNPITIKVGSDLNHEYIKLADVKVAKNASIVALANTDADYEISEANVITFHKPGTYTVTAELPSNTASYHTTAPIQLTALVTAVDPDFSYDTPEPQAFAKSGEYDDVVFTTENTNITADDVTFTFGPATTGWASSYDGFTTNQSVIDEKNNFINSNQLVDGIYTALTSSNYSLDADNGEFTFSFNNLPCSGMYSLTVSPANTDEVDFTPFTINVEVYPTTTNFYTKSLAENKEETTGFNINGIVAASSASDYSGIVTYPILENGKLYMEDYLEFSHIYYPGLYFATVKLYAEGLSSDDVAEPAPKNQVRRAANDLSSDYFDYNYEQTINLSSLTDKQPMVMYVYAEKNGAKTPVSNDGNSEERYNVVTSTDYTVPTGVETIGEEEGVAVYYNLQGVRVENPEHGIYVKVTNGKATKVVL